ncbi:DUF4282 domain-containing protein [Oceanisphaera pacifica]|uniref:DUF4282 domain-containing protein n=1 Tax=Oceanisphaera pacifica TaxID=2818389 RepID=A0ABS3NDV1_9GAMM|nr:DUF4282 domain-containing protein [Oceanisphaera pacifica]MBO1518719.1 DUF4282 domain-containing protein [Oceanisphaera pacifica]
MRNLFFFDAMLTPKIITVVYWILLLSAVISGLGSMFTGYNGFTFGGFLTGLLIAAAGAVFARIWCELMIVLFKINGNLQKIADKQSD